MKPQQRPPWRTEGNEPDYRFSLANERTFLAWIRTALATMAAGVGLMQLVHDDHFAPLRRTLAAVLTLLGVLIALSVYGRWRAAERAMRNGEPLPHSVVLPVMAVVLSVVGLSAVVLVLFT